MPADAVAPDSEPAVTYEERGAVAVITLNRPAKLNALNAEARTQLRASFVTFQEGSARVAVLTGAGDRAFCVGADLKEMAETGLGVPPRDALPYLERNIFVAKPVVAAVNGLAVGGGWLLAQMCDLCIASEKASFGITEAKWGRGAPWAAPLISMIPQRIMMEVLLTAEPLSAARAYEVGLVNRVVSAEKLLPAALELAEKISALAPLTIEAHKRLVYLATEMGRTASLNIADHLFEPVYRSDDAQEGPRAFSERRAPSWKGQ